MSECEYSSRVAAYHDGELPPQRRAEVERHLAECPACAQQLERLRGLSRLLACAEHAPEREGMMRRLHAAVGAAPSRNVVRLCRRVALAAAVLLLVSVGLIWHTGRQQAPTGPPADWEVAAVTLDDEFVEANSRGTLTVWMVSDLSREARQ